MQLSVIVHLVLHVSKVVAFTMLAHVEADALTFAAHTHGYKFVNNPV